MQRELYKLLAESFCLLLSPSADRWEPRGANLCCQRTSAGSERTGSFWMCFSPFYPTLLTVPLIVSRRLRCRGRGEPGQRRHTGTQSGLWFALKKSLSWEVSEGASQKDKPAVIPFAAPRRSSQLFSPFIGLRPVSPSCQQLLWHWFVVITGY